MKLENLQQSSVKATFTVTSEEFEKALDQAFEIVVKDVKVDGFRQGKCPRSMFEKKFGVEALYDEALNVVLNNKAKELYANEEVAQKIIGQFTPAIESEKFERGQDFEVSLTFDVMPEVTLPEYKGLEVKKQVLVATEEEVMEAVNQELSKNATFELKKKQVIALGDTAVFDFLGTVDGVAFDGGSAERYELKIGSGQFIPGFEDQMVGMKAGEVKDVNVTFPDNYPATELAGKAAVFKVTVHEVKEEVLPELNDEYVKTLNIEGVNTVEELKANKKAALEASKVTSERDRQINELFDQVMDNAKVDLPNTLVNELANRMKSQYENQAKMYNIPFETFLSIMGTNVEDFNATCQENGKRQALFQVVVGEIVKVEDIKVEKDELDAKVAEIAEATKQTKQQVFAQQSQTIVSELTYNKVVDLLLSNAKEV